MFLDSRGFVEVETPVLSSGVGGARARPFVTHGNAAAGQLYLRIAPELYLKQLVIGGLERVLTSLSYNPSELSCKSNSDT